MRAKSYRSRKINSPEPTPTKHAGSGENTLYRDVTAPREEGEEEEEEEDAK